MVRLIARGDRAAFEELYRRTAPWLVVRLRRRCADDELVAEVMQETYLAVWQAAGAFAGACVGGSAVGWMWTIAARRLVDAFRRRARQAQVPPAALAAQTVPAAEDLVLGATVGDEMGEVLRRLAPELRQVLQATPRRACHPRRCRGPRHPRRHRDDVNAESSNSLYVHFRIQGFRGQDCKVVA